MKVTTEKTHHIFYKEMEDGGITVCWFDKETGIRTLEEQYKKGVTFPKDSNGNVEPTGVLHGISQVWDEHGKLEIRYLYDNGKMIGGWESEEEWDNFVKTTMSL